MTAPARVGGSSSRGRSSRRKAAAAKAAEAAKTTEKTTGKTTEEQSATTEAPARTERRPRTAAAERAYARRAQREWRAGGEPVRRPARQPRQRGQKQERRPASRASFVMLVMGLLVAGVITTLWLSTQAIADSYRLDEAKKTATELSERAEVLERDVANLQSASTLADEAAKLGMIPGGDPARLVVGPDGKVSVVGDAKPVTASQAPPSSAAQPPPDQPATPPAQGNG
jgi:cell division protein FtsB